MNGLQWPGQLPAPPGFFVPGSKITRAEQALKIIGIAPMTKVLFGLADNLAQRFLRHSGELRVLKRVAILYQVQAHQVNLSCRHNMPACMPACAPLAWPCLGVDNGPALRCLETVLL